MSKTPPLPILTKQEMAHRHLRERILSGAAKPGERVVIDAIAAELGMSPIPVREAISQLAREGLLTLRAHAGAVVSDIPEHSIEEIFALMEVLEIAAARLAFPLVNAELISRLTNLCERMEKTQKVGQWATLNRQFHQALAEHAKLERTLAMQTRIGEDWERLRKLSYSSTQDAAEINQSNQDHRDFIECIQNSDLEAVEQWIRQHNRSALARYRRN